MSFRWTTPSRTARSPCQIRNVPLADAIIAATALVHGLPLVTRNVDDFREIEGLQIVNPLT